MTAPSSAEILDRLTGLHPKVIDMSLDRVRALLADLGDPQDRLPPVIHVAGTNGKGSTVAYLRAMAEAGGFKVHAYTSPHLVRFAERIRVAGALIDDDALIAILQEVERVNAGRPITFFEITTVAAFLAFARAPADLTLLEVGMGGRLDATNVVRHPLIDAIAPISFDHMDYLGDTIAAIAGEKAGIMKPGVPVAIGPQPADAAAVFDARAVALGSPLFRFDREWRIARDGDGLRYEGVHRRALPLPALAGPHQALNAGLAVAVAEMLPGRLRLSDAEIAAGLQRAEWPARLQRLVRGPLVDALPPGCELWLDGGHNEDGARVIAEWARGMADGRPLDMIVALRSTKRAEPFFARLAPVVRRLVCAGNPADSVATPPAQLAAAARRAGIAEVHAATDVTAATALLPGATRVLVCGSLYLAGAVLAENS
ncbi:MAG: bifunctional folylpolyglutamate synthase/dihydrofolate synthase [Alphaproteobacteria bacterium]|nr:bifunctional folylpolyglutamate synthase/dihydrofolate synthase [Alphaproteobacteria bacterium]